MGQFWRRELAVVGRGLGERGRSSEPAKPFAGPASVADASARSATARARAPARSSGGRVRRSPMRSPTRGERAQQGKGYAAGSSIRSPIAHVVAALSVAYFGYRVKLLLYAFVDKVLLGIHKVGNRELLCLSSGPLLHKSGPFG